MDRPGGDEFPSLEALAPLLRPAGIAVIGASADRGRFSGRLVPSLLASGYPGGIYPVNPRYTEVAGLPCFADVVDVPRPCDLVIVAVPARLVPGVLAAAAARGVRAAVVLSAGFGEIAGEQGGQRAAALQALRSQLRIYGPNCPGLWQIADGLVYTFSAQFDPAQLRSGPIGLVTQGGALGRAILDGMQAGLGFTYWFSTGNEADLEISDFVALLADEPRTGVVAVLAEGFRDGRRFLRALARCAQAGKPVVMLKIGRSAAGAAAAAGHTASAQGCPALADALLRRAGCLLVEDVDELADLAGLLARHPRPGGPGLGICTFSGGAGVLLADLCAAAGAPLPALRPATVAALDALLPEIATIGNPTDLTTAVLEDPALARRALEVLAADPGLDLLLFDLPHRLDAFDAALAVELVAAAGAGKPLAVVAHSPVFDREAAAGILREAGIPVFGSARRAASAAARWLGYGAALGGPPYLPEAASTGPVTAGPDLGDPADGGSPVQIGAFEDPIFGPAVAAAAGGAGLHSPSAVFRLAPLGSAEAERMVAELPGLPALRQAGYDGAGIARQLVALARWAADGGARGRTVQVPVAPALRFPWPQAH